MNHLLRVSIVRSGLTNRAVAKHIGISEQAFYSKLRGDTEFKGSEIKSISVLLGLTPEEIDSIFFKEYVN